jgi:hypothetical protein
VLYAIGEPAGQLRSEYLSMDGPVPAELYRSDDGGRSWAPVGSAGAELVACTTAEVWSQTMIGPSGAETALFRSPGVASRRCLPAAPHGATSFLDSAGPCARAVAAGAYLEALVSMRHGVGELLGSCYETCDLPGQIMLQTTAGSGQLWRGMPVTGVAGDVSASFVSARRGFVLGQTIRRPPSGAPAMVSASNRTVLEVTTDAGRSWHDLARFQDGSSG